jgi:hypothetical protein
VIYGGASPEEGPMGDTVYAELPSIHDIGKETVKYAYYFFSILFVHDIILLL